MSESPEERLRSALSSIVGRGESFSNLSARPMPTIAVAMMGEAVEGLAEAYPSDPLYRDWLNLWRAAQQQRPADQEAGE